MCIDLLNLNKFPLRYKRLKLLLSTSDIAKNNYSGMNNNFTKIRLDHNNKLYLSIPMAEAKNRRRT